MSGGSYDYAYTKIREGLNSWPATLEDMAKRCREYAADTPTKSVVKAIQDPNRDPKWGKEYEDVPLTLEDRARIMVKALRLERAAKKIREAADAVDDELEKIMHDVEWVESGDYGPAQLIGKDDVY